MFDERVQNCRTSRFAKGFLSRWMTSDWIYHNLIDTSPIEPHRADDTLWEGVRDDIVASV
jgi:hypothetical protein